MTARRLSAALLMALAVLIARPAHAQPLVADLSSHLISIRTDFAGTEVLLFGATEGEGDVVVIVRGPELPVTVRRKDRIAGIWVNRRQVTFAGVPAFYRVATSRPLPEIVPATAQARYQIGLANLRLEPNEPLDNETTAAFRAGLVRNQERAGLFEREPGRVAFLGARLFRTRIELPANVPTGPYTVEVFLVQDGEISAAQTTPMFVSRAGLSAEVFEFAHREAVLYGLLAVVIALLTGWAASALVRRT